MVNFAGTSSVCYKAIDWGFRCKDRGTPRPHGCPKDSSCTRRIRRLGASSLFGTRDRTRKLNAVAWRSIVAEVRDVARPVEISVVRNAGWTFTGWTGSQSHECPPKKAFNHIPNRVPRATTSALPEARGGEDEARRLEEPAGPV